MSGLIKRVNTDEDIIDPDKIVYDFLSDNLRNTLLESGLVTDAVRVQEEISRFINEHYDDAFSFQAIIRDPKSTGDIRVSEELRPFAKVTASVLEQLGGKYTQLSKKIKSYFIKKEPVDPARFSPEHEEIKKENIITDADIQQATCAVLNEAGKTVGTAWLASSEGHLLTAGHLLGRNKPEKRIQIQFSGDIPRIAYRVGWGYQEEMGIDFAVVQLEDKLPNRHPLPVQLPRSVSGGFRLHGYGKNLAYLSSANGKFGGSYNREGYILFQVDSKQVREEGYSGGAIVSDELRAVVAIQIQTTSASIGAGRDTVATMPLYRIARLWEPLYTIAGRSLSFSNSHALVIGVSSYSPYANDLPCALEDAKGLADIFKDEERCAYPPQQVVLLTDNKADRAGILRSLDKLAQVTDADSTVVIYFSGHGGTKDGGYYFCPYGFNPVALQETAISGPEFKDKIAAIPAKKKLILLDCNHAEGIVSGIKGEPLSKASVQPEPIELFKHGKGYAFIVSSAKDESSYIGKPYSIFTGALIEALCGKGTSEEDGYVRVSDLAMYIRERVSRLTEDKQHPVMHFVQVDNFVLAYYAGGEETPKTLSFDLRLESNDLLIKSVREIEELFFNSHYKQAYMKFYQLCGDYPGYRTQAAAIISRYNELENQIIQCTLPLGEQEIIKLEITNNFHVCLHKFKQKNKVVEQQDDLLDKIREIDEAFVNAHYKQAYELFYQLCEDYPDYRSQAETILSRYNYLQNQIINGILPLSEQRTVASDIKLDFQFLLQNFRQEF
ncbi:MAG: hypothetical protein D3925_13235, partial [Candidatus Electrothrix sp. AR5]|nr:hypothetical protein [Candidatus Electrothrix sp. AR5]